MACGVILADVTSRVRDLAAPQSWCAGQGLHQNSVQPLDEYGFTLYFHAYQREPARHGSITAVANRPWLWQRPDTLFRAGTPTRIVTVRSAATAGSMLLPLGG